MPSEIERLPVRTMTYQSSDLIRYAAASGDFNPIHYDRCTAESYGLPGIVVHGMLNMAVLGRYLDSWNRGRFHLVDFRTRFRGFVEPNQPIRLEGIVKRRDPDYLMVQLSVTVVGQDKPAVTAEATLAPAEVLSGPLPTA